MQFFGGHQRETLLQVKPRLITENAVSSYTSAVFFLMTVIQDVV